MLSRGATPDWALVDIAVPHPSDRLPGVSMAGFRHRASVCVDIAMVAHPCVSLFIDLGEGEGLVHHTRGRHGRGSVVVGLLPGDLRTGGRAGECLQIRLDPAAAAVVLDAAAEFTGAVVSLADVWGRDAGTVGHRPRRR